MSNCNYKREDGALLGHPSFLNSLELEGASRTEVIVGHDSGRKTTSFTCRTAPTLHVLFRAGLLGLFELYAFPNYMVSQKLQDIHFLYQIFQESVPTKR